MKKILILLIIILTVSSCNSKEQQILEKEYYQMLDLANNCDRTDEVPFSVEFTLNELIDNYLVYRLYIDNPKENINNIEAIIIHNYKTDDVFPNTGIYETKLHLVPDEINEKENKVKGIILIGYINYEEDLDNFDANFKAFIKYNNTSSCFVKEYSQNRQ